jgi:hypothetical protein
MVWPIVAWVTAGLAIPGEKAGSGRTAEEPPATLAGGVVRGAVVVDELPAKLPKVPNVPGALAGGAVVVDELPAKLPKVPGALVGGAVVAVDGTTAGAQPTHADKPRAPTSVRIRTPAP